jgi:hypothetical protein
MQYGEAAEHAAYGEEFMKAMSFFTRHSLTGGSTSLKVTGAVLLLTTCNGSRLDPHVATLFVDNSKLST